MGTIQYIVGNIFETKRKVIAHGCNTVGGFGSGMAGQIAKLYPEVRTAYMNKYKRQGWKLGEIQIVSTEKFVVVNMATQKTFGYTGVHINYDACDQAFEKLLIYAELHELDVAIPRIGSGLAGGKWELVEEKLLKNLKQYNVEVDVYSLN